MITINRSQSDSLASPPPPPAEEEEEIMTNKRLRTTSCDHYAHNIQQYSQPSQDDDQERGTELVVVITELQLFPLTPGDLKPSPVNDEGDVVHGAVVPLTIAPPYALPPPPPVLINDDQRIIIRHDHDEEHHEEVWEIRKRLTKSDTNANSRLLISTRMAKLHVLHYLSEANRKRVEEEEEEAVDVEVWDVDTGSMHNLDFKRWRSSGSYIFNNLWKEGFVKRRNLNERDEVALYFDRQRLHFVFSVLNRAAPLSL